MVARWREMMGPTNPKDAKPGDIRWFARNESRMADNVAHGSDTLEAANRELAWVFNMYPPVVGYSNPNSI